MADEKKALEGHRRAVREHIAKWEHYSLPHEKHFAYKTIQNAQAQIAKILKRHRHWLPGWEDHWIPGQPHPEITDWMPDD